MVLKMSKKISPCSAKQELVCDNSHYNQQKTVVVFDIYILPQFSANINKF